jgi:hypothetical protein
MFLSVSSVRLKIKKAIFKGAAKKKISDATYQRLAGGMKFHLFQMY